MEEIDFIPSCFSPFLFDPTCLQGKYTYITSQEEEERNISHEEKQNEKSKGNSIIGICARPITSKVELCERMTGRLETRHFIS